MTIKDLQTKYKLRADDFWELKQGYKPIWIIRHEAVEKIMAVEGIEVYSIDVLNTEWNFCRLRIKLCLPAKGKDKCKIVMTIGEALLNENTVINVRKKFNKKTQKWYEQETKKGNCESQYIGAMAEKRGIDRAVLKLINAYEYGIYSDVEAESFEKPSVETSNSIEKLVQKEQKYAIDPNGQ